MSVADAAIQGSSPYSPLVPDAGFQAVLPLIPPVPLPLLPCRCPLHYVPDRVGRHEGQECPAHAPVALPVSEHLAVRHLAVKVVLEAGLDVSPSKIVPQVVQHELPGVPQRCVVPLLCCMGRTQGKTWHQQCRRRHSCRQEAPLRRDGGFMQRAVSGHTCHRRILRSRIPWRFCCSCMPTKHCLRQYCKQQQQVLHDGFMCTVTVIGC